jgi:hypothetical protein
MGQIFYSRTRVTTQQHVTLSNSQLRGTPPNFDPKNGRVFVQDPTLPPRIAELVQDPTLPPKMDQHSNLTPQNGRVFVRDLTSVARVFLLTVKNLRYYIINYTVGGIFLFGVYFVP